MLPTLPAGRTDTDSQSILSNRDEGGNAVNEGATEQNTAVNSSGNGSRTEIDPSNILNPSDGVSTRHMTAEAEGNVIQQVDDDIVILQTELGDDDQYHVIYNAETASDFGTPESFEEAWNGKDKDRWRPSLVSEVMNFIKRKSWVKKPRAEAIKAGKTIMKTKIVFKIKTESDESLRFKTRIVTKGFQMIRGVDYHGETFSPVCSQTATRMSIALTLYHQHDEEPWTIELYDVQAAFLETSIFEPLYIKWPDGMVEMGFITEQEKEESCILLVHGMYGNKDSALLYNKEFSKHVTDPKGMNMEQSLIDPCVFYKKENGKLVLIVNSHVDDNLCCGTRKALDWFKEGIGKRFKFTEEGKLRKHLGVWYEWKKDSNGELYIEATMPELVEQIVSKAEKNHLEDYNKEMKKRDTPGTPGESLDKNHDETVKAEQYRSIAGKCMYLTTQVWVSGSNCTRELTRHFSNPGKEHWNEVYHIAGYLKAHPDQIKLTYRKPKGLRPGAMIDGAYATSKYDRRSVSGMIYTLGGCIVNWGSSTQKLVTLSTAEMEYLVVTPTVQEIKFKLMLLDEYGCAEYPGFLLQDNTASLFIINNKHVGNRTKHIDVRYRFCLQHYPHVFVALYCPTDLNESDNLTKNQSVDLYKRHSYNISNGQLYIMTKWDYLVECIKNKKYLDPGRMSKE